MLLSGVVTPWLAPIVALFLVFAESAVATQLITSCCLSSAQDAVFDAVYSNESPEAGITIDAASSSSGVFRTMLLVAQLSLCRGFVMLVALPLNLVPVVSDH